jgi:hypothetical protein
VLVRDTLPSIMVVMSSQSGTEKTHTSEPLAQGTQHDIEGCQNNEKVRLTGVGASNFAVVMEQKS